MVLLMTSCIFKRTSTVGIITVILSGLEEKQLSPCQQEFLSPNLCNRNMRGTNLFLTNLKDIGDVMIL